MGTLGSRKVSVSMVVSLLFFASTFGCYQSGREASDSGSDEGGDESTEDDSDDGTDKDTDDSMYDCSDECYGSYNTMDFYNGGGGDDPLGPIANTTCISGDLSLTDALGDSSDLSCLAEVSGDLTISHNSSLSTLSLLDELTFVGGELSVTDNSSLPYCEVCALVLQLEESSPTLPVNVSGNLNDECWDGSSLDCSFL